MYCSNETDIQDSRIEQNSGPFAWLTRKSHDGGNAPFGMIDIPIANPCDPFWHPFTTELLKPFTFLFVDNGGWYLINMFLQNSGISTSRCHSF